MEYGRRGIWPGGTRNNRQWLNDKIDFDPGVDELSRMMLCDAVTSGGLLIAVARERTDELAAALKQAGTLAAAVIGECVAENPGRVRVLP